MFVLIELLNNKYTDHASAIWQIFKNILGTSLRPGQLEEHAIKNTRDEFLN